MGLSKIFFIIIIIIIIIYFLSFSQKLSIEAEIKIINFKKYSKIFIKY